MRPKKLQINDYIYMNIPKRYWNITRGNIIQMTDDKFYKELIALINDMLLGRCSLLVLTGDVIKKLSVGVYMLKVFRAMYRTCYYCKMNDVIINKDLDDNNKYYDVDMLVIDDIYKTNLIDSIKNILKNRYDNMRVTVCIFSESMDELVDIYHKNRDFRMIRV